MSSFFAPTYQKTIWPPFAQHLLHIDINIQYEKLGFKNAANELGSLTLPGPTGGAYNLTTRTESTFRKKKS